jgi:hypothetical protein
MTADEVDNLSGKGNTAADRADDDAAGYFRARRGFIIALAAVLVTRLVWGAVYELVPDEAYYWTWSRHLAAGYLDHPAMVALLVRLGTRIAGNTELGVRLGTIVLAVGTALLAPVLARQAGLSRREAAVAGLALALMPLISVLAAMVTPDTPAIFFQTATLACALRASRSGDDGAKAPGPGGSIRWWLATGLFGGLSLESKYTAIVTGAAIGMAMLCSPRGRRMLLSPGPLFACVLALLVFAPNLLWNATHQFKSMRFQWHHGSTNIRPLDLKDYCLNVAQYVGGQMLVVTPVFFALLLLALVRSVRRYRSLTLPWQMLVWTAALPLAFFFLMSIRRRGEINWPAFACIPMMPLIVRQAFVDWRGGRGLWLRRGMIVAGCMAAAIQIPDLALIATPPRWKVTRKFTELFGWREMARQVEGISQGDPVFCSMYETAAELSFYMTGQPDTFVTGSDRATASDDFPNRPDLASPRITRLVYVGANPNVQSPPEIVGAGFDQYPRMGIDLRVERDGYLIRDRGALVAQKGPKPPTTTATRGAGP